MNKYILLAIIFVMPFIVQGNDIKDNRQLNKIHASPINDSYIIVFNGSPKSFSIDKISIDKPKERLLKKMRFLSDEDDFAIKVFDKKNKFLYTLGIGNPFYANYQHIGFEDRNYMGGLVSSAKVEIAIPIHVQPSYLIISKRNISGKFEDIQEISLD